MRSPFKQVERLLAGATTNPNEAAEESKAEDSSRSEASAAERRHGRRALARGTCAFDNQRVALESLRMAGRQQRPLVLIIDEEETVRELYGHWFFALGFEVMCAIGIRGLSLALRLERPQLIVTELRARDLTLRHLTARLRSNDATRCIPVIVLTKSCDPHALNDAKAEGASVVLPKLADFQELQIWVRALCQ
jgi:CheY-like chemotaxis protein